MRRTGAVISGSAALAMIHLHQFTPNDIDFYVLPFDFADVLKYIENHGYEIVLYDPSILNYFHQNIVVIRLVHPISRKSVNITTSLDNHVVKLITRFHSTLVMNYISWFGLVILYPEWTLQKQSLVIHDTPNTRACVRKYINRGYTCHHNNFELTRPLQTHICRRDPYCPRTTRSLHDDCCLVAPFEADFEFKTDQRNMTWTLPILCSFDSPLTIRT
jgi:hypothetical protein